MFDIFNGNLRSSFNLSKQNFHTQLCGKLKRFWRRTLMKIITGGIVSRKVCSGLWQKAETFPELFSLIFAERTLMLSLAGLVWPGLWLVVEVIINYANNIHIQPLNVTSQQSLSTSL